jgi:hypothetical protein
VEAYEAAQHMRRILWRFGDIQKEPEISVTTRVNSRDMRAGCIAIAAVWGTAKRFAGGMEEAAWFLKNSTVPDHDGGRRK